MKQRLTILNLIIAALVIAAAWRWRQLWLEAKERDQMVLYQSIINKKLTPPPPQAMPQAVAAIAYADVAQKNLFARDRNPMVIVPPAPPPPAPPPPPPNPLLYGLMNFDGVSAIMAEKTGAPQKGYRAGDQIGDWKLVAINLDKQSMLLEWNGQQYEKSMSELATKDVPPPQIQQNVPVASNAPAVKSISSAGGGEAKGPGDDVGGGTRGCQPGDTSPAGTVQDGYKKELHTTPFGNSCQWVKVR